MLIEESVRLGPSQLGGSYLRGRLETHAHATSSTVVLVQVAVVFLRFPIVSMPCNEGTGVLLQCFQPIDCIVLDWEFFLS